jgi:hypothetical protein
LARVAPTRKRGAVIDKDIMKKLALLLLGCSLAFSSTALGETKDADQKWLEAVQKMVAKGESKVSTPKEVRANLLKEWGSKHGYSVKTTKTETGYRIEVSKSLAQK